MNLSDQLCSLELAKKLKELGVKQESLFYWGAYENPLSGIVSEETCPSDRWFIFDSVDRVYKNCPPDWIYSSFTVSELGKMLPVCIEANNFCHEIIMCISDEEYRTNDLEEFILERPRLYQIGYKPIEKRIEVLTESFFEDVNEADARAKMLIWLIENGHVKV